MEEKTCPKCNTSNPIAANFCRHCRYEFPEATKNGSDLRPSIQYFRVKEDKFVVGSTIHVEWKVENYNRIELNEEDVTLYNEVEVTIDKAAILYLVAYNDYTQIKESLRIIPTPLPFVRFFSASRSAVMKGEQTRLSWEVENTVKVLLRFGSEEIDVSETNEYYCSPESTITFTLVAFSVDEKQSIEQRLTIKVQDEVGINRFYSDVNQVYESQPVRLFWDVDNAEKIMLFPGDVDVTSSRSLTVYPSHTTTYRLVASNLFTEKEQLHTVMVRTLPRIDVNVTNSLTRLQVPSCNVDFSPMLESIKETNIDKWIMAPAKQPVFKRIWRNNLLMRFLKAFKTNDETA